MSKTRRGGLGGMLEPRLHELLRRRRYRRSILRAGLLSKPPTVDSTDYGFSYHVDPRRETERHLTALHVCLSLWYDRRLQPCATARGAVRSSMALGATSPRSHL